jgi:hypothetical protein
VRSLCRGFLWLRSQSNVPELGRWTPQRRHTQGRTPHAGPFCSRAFHLGSAFLQPRPFVLRTSRRAVLFRAAENNLNVETGGRLT